MNIPTHSQRGVSTVIGYVLGLGITTILITSLLIGVGTFLESQTTRAQQQGFEVIGQQAAADAEQVDSLILNSGGDYPISRETTLPDEIATTTYKISIQSIGSTLYELRVFADTGEEMTITIRSYTPIEETEVSGGDIRFRYEPADNEVKVDEAT